VNGFRGSHPCQTVFSLVAQMLGVGPEPTPKSLTLGACKCMSIIGWCSRTTCGRARHVDRRTRSNEQTANAMYFFICTPCLTRRTGQYCGQIAILLPAWIDGMMNRLRARWRLWRLNCLHCDPPALTGLRRVSSYNVP